MSASVTIRSITPSGIATCANTVPWWNTYSESYTWARCKYAVTITDPTYCTSRYVATIEKFVQGHPEQSETYTTGELQSGEEFTLSYLWYTDESEPSASFIIDVEIVVGIRYWDVNITQAQPALGTIDGGGRYNYDTVSSVTITATPFSYARFRHWVVNGSTVITDNPYALGKVGSWSENLFTTNVLAVFEEIEPGGTGILCDASTNLILCDSATGAVLHGVTS